MVRRSAALLAALAFLLPLAAVAGSCDCLGSAASPDCCPPSCCACCVHSPSVLTASPWGAQHPAPVHMASNPRQDPYPSTPPRDIFHVPKTSRL